MPPTEARPEIRVEKIRRASNALACSFTYGTALEPFFSSSVLYVNYDFPLDEIPESVLSIPVLGLLVPVAWAVGADVTVHEADSRFLASLRQVGEVMHGLYPSVKLNTEVHCTPIETPWPEGGARDCLLYSGGVDSTSSIIRNLGPRLTLATVRGTPDLRLWEGEFWERQERSLGPFLKSIGIERHIVETNAMDVVSLEGLNDALKGAFEKGWWENLSHGLILLSLCAPLTYKAGISRMMIASSYSQGEPEPWGSTPASDEQIKWGNVTTLHDSFDLSRREKMKKILGPYISEHPGLVQLRVCTGKRERRLASGTLNCGTCEKCVRTMLGLMWTGVDPAGCGFPPPDFALIKEKLVSGRLQVQPTHTMGAIHDMKAPPAVELAARYPAYGGFLDWFYHWEIPTKTRRRSSISRLAPTGSRRRRVLDAALH